MVFNKPLKSLEEYAGVAPFTRSHKYSYGKLNQQKRNKRRRQSQRQTQPKSKTAYQGLHEDTTTEDKTKLRTAHNYSRLSTETPSFPGATNLIWKSRKRTSTTATASEKDKTSTPRDESTVSSSSNDGLLEQFPIGQSIKSLEISDRDKSTTSKKVHEKKAVDTIKKRKIEEASFNSIVRSAKIFSAMKSSQANTARSSGQGMKISYPVCTTEDSFKLWNNNESKNVFEGVKNSGGSGNIDKSWDDEYIPTTKKTKGVTNNHKNHDLGGTKYSSSVFDNLDQDTWTKQSSSLFENLGEDEDFKVKGQLKVNESREDDDGRHEKNDVSKGDPLSTGREESFDGGSFEALTFSAGGSNDSEVSDDDPFKEIFKVFRCTDRQRSFYSNEDDVKKSNSPRGTRRTSMHIKEVSVPAKDVRNAEEKGKIEIDQSNERSQSQSSCNQKNDSRIELTDRKAENIDETFAQESRNPTDLAETDAGRSSKGVIVQEKDVGDLAGILLSTKIHDDNDRANIQEDVAFDVGDKKAVTTNERMLPQMPSRQLHWHPVTSPRKKIAISDVTSLPDNLTPVARIRFCRTTYGATKMLV